MRHLTIALLSMTGCSRSTPPPDVLHFADREKLTQWFAEQCSVSRGTTNLVDYTLPAGMEHVTIFTVPMTAQMTCSGKLSNLQNVRVELQGGGRPVCAVRIGPADARARIDPRFIQDWFSDPTLGSRVSNLLAGWDVPNYRQIGTVDGIRIAVSQQQLAGSSTFYLVADACGHVPDPGRQTSAVY